MGTPVLTRFRRLAPRSRPVLFGKGDYSLHAMITGVGYEVRSPEDGYDWHGLRRGHAEFALFQHTLAGRGCLTWEGREFEVLPGQSMLLQFPHDNRYWLPRDAPMKWEFFYLCLNGSEVIRAFRSAITKLGPVVELNEHVVAAAAQGCLDVLSDRIVSPGQMSALAYDLSMRLLDAATPAHSLRNDRPTREPSIQAAIDCCRRRLTDPRLSVTHMADAAGFSRFHFSRRFRASEGMSPTEFIVRERMKEATKLLQSTNEPVKRIAIRCGFADPNYFCKAFRRSFGVSPGAFRHSGMYASH